MKGMGRAGLLEYAGGQSVIARQGHRQALTYFWKSASPYYFTYAQARA